MPFTFDLSSKQDRPGLSFLTATQRLIKKHVFPLKFLVLFTKRAQREVKEIKDGIRALTTMGAGKSYIASGLEKITYVPLCFSKCVTC
jgi:hypothetical protein